MDEHDIVIVGGGPAGLSAGFFLKRAKPELDVLIIDRLDERKYARYHRMCGEAVSKAAFKELSPLVPDHIVHHIGRVEERWPGGLVLETRATGYVLDRPAFLQGIRSRFQAMGGKVVTDAVKTVSRGEKSIELATTSGTAIRCRYLLGADGANSVVRRSLFDEKPPVLLWTEQYLVRKKLDSDLLTFVQGERYKGGYRWEFPAGDLARIGFPRGTDQIAEEVVEVHRRAIPAGGLSKIANGNALLLGDAAAMANPLTAGGIRIALLSGRRAAESKVKGNVGSYQRWWDGSPFSRAKYLKAFRRLQGMTDRDYSRAARPLGGRFGPLSFARAYITMPEFRDIYRAYPPSGKYGW